MEEYRVLLKGEEVLTSKSLYKVLNYIRENYQQYGEGDFVLEQFLDSQWDEWLDKDDQNLYEHLYAYDNEEDYFEEEEVTDFVIQKEDDEDEDSINSLSEVEELEDEDEDQDRLLDVLKDANEEEEENEQELGEENIR